MRKTFALLLVTLVCRVYGQNYLLQGPGTSPANSVIYQDGSGNVGIGTATPAANLDVYAASSAPSIIQSSYQFADGTTSPYGTANYFTASRVMVSLTLPGPTITYSSPITDFSINSVGQVGIGAAALGSHCDLFIRDHGYAGLDNLLNTNILMGGMDDGHNLLFALANVGSAETPSGAIFIGANPTNPYPADPFGINPALIVANNAPTVSNPPPTFGVGGEGVVTIGASNIIAQLDVVKNNSVVDNLFHVGKDDEVYYGGSYYTTSRHYFTVDNNGYIGVGQPSAGNSLMEISDVAGVGAYIPILQVDNGTASTATPYFKLWGSSTGVNAGIGVDPLSFGSTLALQGINGTALDLHETTTTTTSDVWNTQIRFIGADGNVRHVIADDIGPTGTNNLVVHPGYGGGANNTMQIEGNELVNANAQINAGVSLNQGDPGSGMYYNQLAFMDGSGNIRQEFTNQSTDLLLNLNPYGHGSGVLKVSGAIVIGNVTAPSGYNLYVQNGILAERFKCAASTDAVNWSDYVFDKKYKLMSISELGKFVKKNKHLPDIPTAREVKENGIDLAEMDAKLLAKIEELSLYIIEQQKELDKLKKGN